MSVRLRTALAAAGVFALVYAVTAVIGIALLRQSLIDEVDRSIETRALDIEIQTADEEVVPFVGAGLDPSTAAAVVDVGGVVLSSTDDLDGARLVELYRANDGAFDVSFPDLDSVQGSESMRAIAITVEESDDFLETFVFVAASTAGVDRTVRGATVAALVAGPMLVLVVGLLVWVMAGRALRPVERIRREVEAIGGDELDRRVPEPDTGDEIAALAATMNTMLGRIEQATEQQRRFAADASHELRSPLASIASQVDVDLAHPEQADWPATAEAVRGEAHRMQTLVDDLLLLARSDAGGRPVAGSTVALDDVAFDAIARVSTTPGVPIAADAVERVDVIGDAGQLDRLVTNLLVNARRHARSRVRVGVHTAGGGVFIAVDDDGDGIAEADRDRVFERFVRLDEARSRNDGGSGLGLALCREIARLHGGSIELGDSDLGGARFVVTIPAA